VRAPILKGVIVMRGTHIKRGPAGGLQYKKVMNHVGAIHNKKIIPPAPSFEPLPGGWGHRLVSARYRKDRINQGVGQWGVFLLLDKRT
jgi:hypothetical protein